MKAIATVTIKEVHKRVSTTDNVYFLISFKEELPHIDEKGNKMFREFNDVYMPECKDENALKATKDKEVIMEANFYAMQRQNNGRIFQDIKMSILDIDNINERDNGNTEE